MLEEGEIVGPFIRRSGRYMKWGGGASWHQNVGKMEQNYYDLSLQEPQKRADPRNLAWENQYLPTVKTSA